MPSEQEGSHGISESANASGSQPIALPLFAVQPHNIIPVEIIAKRFLATTIDSAQSSPEQFNPPNAQLAIEEPIIQSESQQAQVLMNVRVISTDEPFRAEISLIRSMLQRSRTRRNRLEDTSVSSKSQVSSLLTVRVLQILPMLPKKKAIAPMWGL